MPNVFFGNLPPWGKVFLEPMPFAVFQTLASGPEFANRPAVTPKMLRDHYDAVVSKENARAYLGIFPPTSLASPQEGGERIRHPAGIPGFTSVATLEEIRFKNGNLSIPLLYVPSVTWVEGSHRSSDDPTQPVLSSVFTDCA